MESTRRHLKIREEALRVFDVTIGLLEQDRERAAAVAVGRSVRTIRRWVMTRRRAEGEATRRAS